MLVCQQAQLSFAVAKIPYCVSGSHFILIIFGGMIHVSQVQFIFTPVKQISILY